MWIGLLTTLRFSEVGLESLTSNYLMNFGEEPDIPKL